MRRGGFRSIWGLVMAVGFLLGCPAWQGQGVLALDVKVGEELVTVGGYLKQSVAYGVSGNQYDTKQQFQSFLTQALLEMRYEARPDLKFFVSGKGNVDWAYPVFAGNNEWNEKKFDTAYNKLFILDDWQDVLSEAHVSYVKNNFFARFGKQIVAWGETDGFRLMDQINPLDQRRGLSDVTFENTIIPVWLLRTEYRQPVTPNWLQDLTYQFVFNPNLKYRGSQSINPAPGTEGLGIWALNVAGPRIGNRESHIGSFVQNLDTPQNFSPDGFKYAGRVTGTIQDTRITLNGFYGRNNDFVWRGTGPAFVEISPWDGQFIIHPYTEAYYPLFKFVGATASRDLDFLKFGALGGVAPVLRLEALYAFNSTFMTSINTLEKFDELRWAAGVDWKIRVPWLNDKAYFFLSPQIYNRRVMNFPGNYTLSIATDPVVRENTWMTTILINTTYLHNKLQPSFFWMHDWSNRCGFIKPEVAYEHSDKWKYAVGAVLISGDKVGAGLQPLDHKSHVYLSTTYTF